MNESKPGANAPPDDDAQAPSSLTSETETTIHTSNTNPKGTMTMTNNSASTLVEGTNVTGVVESKNQHGVSLNIDGAPAFLPVANMGSTQPSDLAKGSELAVTVVDTSGSKPRVAIADVAQSATAADTPAEEGSNFVVEETPAAVVATVEESPVAEVVESAEDAPVEGDELSASIARLAASWGASVKIETSSRKPSSKPAKVRKVAPVVNAVDTPAAVVVEPVKAVVEPEQAPEPVVESNEPASAKTAFFDSINVGDVVKATVKFKKDFGVHLVVGKLGFGLLHVTEMPGETPEDRKSFLAGLRYKQELSVRVIKKDTTAARLGFSMIADEKADFFASVKVGDVVEGTVSGTKEIGAFVNLGKTVGFLHVSEVEGKTREVRDGNLAAMKRGEKLELVVVDVNRDKQEVRLSQRRLQLSRLAQGTEVTGTFSSVRGNSVVVDLAVGGRGFLPKKGAKRFEYGEEITAVVKSVNVAQNTVELV